MINRYFSILMLAIPTLISAYVHRIQNSTNSAIGVSAVLLAGPVEKVKVPANGMKRLDVGGYLTAAFVIEGLDGSLKGVKKGVRVPDPKFGKDIVIGSGQGDFIVQID